MKLSLVICAYNEELNVAPLSEQIRNALAKVDYEVIFVDDGSTDNTVDEVQKQASQHPNFKLVELRKNYGQSAALAAGIDHAKGQYIATMDGDLQNDPTDLPQMLELIETGKWDMITGKRANRQDKAFSRKLPSKIANWIIRRSTKITIKDYGCSIRVFEAEIAKGMGLYGELHRFIPVLAHLQGAKIHQIDVKHHARIHGTSKYGIGRTFKVMADLIFIIFLNKYMPRSMHLFGGIGLMLTLVGAAINLYLLVYKLMGNDIWGKPLLILGVLTLIGGIQFITFGIMSEVQMRTYYESQEKKHYTVRRLIN